MIYLSRKLKTTRALFFQLLFTVLAFSTLIILSYLFMRSVVHANLLRTTATIINSSEEHVSTVLDESKTALDNFADTAEEMLLRGDDLAALSQYVDESAAYLRLYGKDAVSTSCFYLYLETAEEPLLIHNSAWELPAGYQPEEQAWYRLIRQPNIAGTDVADLPANNMIAETVPTIDDATGEITFTYAVSLAAPDGRYLGVACLDVRIDAIVQNIVRTALNQNSYGILLNQYLMVLGHPNEDYIGHYAGDELLPFTKYAAQLQNGENVSEGFLTTYRGEPGVAFFQRLSNGWYLGLVSPQKQYYQSMTAMTYTLIALGVTLTIILCAILISIDAAKNRANTENRQKSTFLANMSHEIRTPINAIVGMATVGKSAADLPRKDYCFAQINDASQHLLSIINDILDISKMDANKLALVPADYNFNRMLAQVRTVIGGRIEEQRQNFHVTVGDDIPAVLNGDEYRLRQVLINLLANAVKFTPEGGDIYLNIYLSEEKDKLCTITAEVIDTGIGIAPEHLARIFQAFEQADNRTSRKYGGTGLGLVISKRIVEMMGGKISVTSVPGEGSRFTFTFKAARGEAPGPGEAAANAAAGLAAADSGLPQTGELAGCHILLAEDVIINREIILMFMEETGAEIDCAENGTAVLQLLDSNPGKYDLILMDVQMPEMDGLEATREIRKRGETLPIIATTANVFKEDIDNCLAAGMNDYLSKPLNLASVIKMVHQYWP